VHRRHPVAQLLGEPAGRSVFVGAGVSLGLRLTPAYRHHVGMSQFYKYFGVRWFSDYHPEHECAAIPAGMHIRFDQPSGTGCDGVRGHA
jgi:hypothetical protein